MNVLGSTIPTYEVVAIVAAFLIGSIPFGLVVGRLFFKRDIRGEGSGNIGAANALRTMGTTAGLAVLALDALKGAVATLLPVALFAVPFGRYGPATFEAGSGAITTVMLGRGVIDEIAATCAIAAMLGHCYSPWLRFRGGKGVATLLGVLAVASWPSALVFGAVWLAIVVPTGFASLGSMLGTIAACAVVARLVGTWTIAYSCVAVALIVWQHRANIARLAAGNENKLRLISR